MKTSRILAAILAGGFAFTSHATIITIGSDEVGGLSGNDLNDCSGYFTVGAGDCAIFGPIDSGGYDENSTLISPAIAKFQAESDTAELFDFPTIDGSEFDAPYSAGTGTITFNYTPGDGDPILRFWIAKAASGWTLYFDGDATACANKFSVECLASAAGVTTGEFSSERLSHVTFYDSLRTTVPEPGTLALLGAALLASAVVRRRKSA